MNAREVTGTRGHPVHGAARQEFLERQPTYWIKRCYGALRRAVDADLRAYGLTLSQRDALLTLYHRGPLSQGELRAQLGLEQSSVSRLVEGLVSRGWVSLSPGSQDRRERVAQLTPDGEETLLCTPGASALGGSLMVEGLAPAECEELMRLLRRCTENLERNR